MKRTIADHYLLSVHRRNAARVSCRIGLVVVLVALLVSLGACSSAPQIVIQQQMLPDGTPLSPIKEVTRLATVVATATPLLLPRAWPP